MQGRCRIQPPMAKSGWQEIGENAYCVMADRELGAPILQLFVERVRL